MATRIVSFHTDSDRVRMRNEIREQIVAKLSDKEYRDIFVSEQINTGLAFQISAMREQRGWTQSELGEKAGMAQSRISVMEDANYSRFSLSTLKRLASAFDVALIVRFEPFSKLVDHFASLNAASLSVTSFDEDAFYEPTVLPESTVQMNLKGTGLSSFASLARSLPVGNTAVSTVVVQDTPRGYFLQTVNADKESRIFNLPTTPVPAAIPSRQLHVQ